MINTLVSLNADLASSIAFRYACRLMQFADMRLQAIHVEEVTKEEFPPGSGWVLSTWEKGLLQNAQEEIAQLINAERSSCPPMDLSIVRIGNREEELLSEIEANQYDLLLEGVLNSFDAQLFHKKVHSKLYKDISCPIILVKNLVDPGRVALLVGDIEDVKPLASTFLTLFAKSKLTVDLIYFTDLRSGQDEFKKLVAEAPPSALDKADRVIAAAKTLLAEQGRAPQETWRVRNKPQKIGEMLGEYGLVGAFIPRAANRSNFIMDLLSRVSSATLFCKP